MRCRATPKSRKQPPMQSTRIAGHRGLVPEPDTVPLHVTDNKPYRPNVGIALFNSSGQVLIGRRFRDDGPEIILPGLEWQMPQGGIDADEDPRDAVMRELWEETGVKERRLSRRNRLAELRVSALRGPATPAREISRPASKVVRAALHRLRWRDRSLDAAQRPAGGVRPVALGTARPRRRSGGAVPTRVVPDGGARIFEICRAMSGCNNVSAPVTM